MRSRKNRVSRVPASPDLEKGPVKVLEDERPTTEEPEAGGEQVAGDDDSDNNDKFWKMFQEEAAAEASWKVDIWKTDLDSLLVFAGLFAAVVSAFLIDLRFHLRPDPVLTALNGIASILRNETEPPELEHARPVVRGVGFLWYGSLVVTLIGALWGVLAKGWLGELLREPPNNPADRAMERWRRDKAARKWHLEIVITAVPLLTQIGLAMFLSGFVVQSFDDNHGIGVLVLVYVTLGALAYAIFTILPIFRPDCPYRTPLTNFFDPVSAPKVSTLDENTQSKIQILVSRLNRSSNDEIFTSAASVLDAKLESSDSDKWLKGVEKRASEIADAFSVRLKSFAHRVHSIRVAPSVLKDVTAHAGTASGEALMAPMEQGITCLRVLLKSIEASTLNPEGDKSPWVKQDIDRNWRISDIYPPTWRLLSLSIHITKLVATKDDYDGGKTVEIDWKNLISKTFSDLTVRSISGTSACRGLLHGEPNLRRICALGLAMFIETEATTQTDSPKLLFFEKDSDPGVDAGKIITEKLWSELVGIWKDAAVELVCHARSEGEAESSFNNVLDHDLYQEDIKRSISETILNQLDHRNWTVRKQAIQILTKLSEHHAFQEAILTSSVIPKVISKLEDNDEDVRAAAIRALSTFSEQYLDVFTDVMKKEKGIPRLIATLTDKDVDVRTAAAEALLAFATRGGPLKPTDSSRLIFIAKIYQPDIKSALPDITKLLDHDNWRIRKQTIRLLCQLADLDAFQETLKTAGIIASLVAKLADSDSDVHAAAVPGVLTFGTRELYYDDIKAAIPTIVQQMEDDKQWATRESAIKILMKFSEIEIFRDMIRAEGLVSKLVARLEDDDTDVREAVTSALRILSAQELYRSDIESSIPTMVKQLRHQSWTARLEAIKMLAMLSEYVVFQESIKANGALTELVARLSDNDDDVREAAAKALLAFGTQSYFQDTVNSENTVSFLCKRLIDNSGKVRAAVVQALSALSAHDIYSKDIKASVSIFDLVKQLQDESWSAREQAVEILAKFAPNADFQAAMHSEKTVPALVAMLVADRDEDVRTAVAKALSVFGTQDYFQKAMKYEKAIAKLAARLSDQFASVRNSAQSTLLTLSGQVFYQGDIKSAIPNVMKQLDDKYWATRQQVIRMLVQLCERPIFQEIMKTEMVIAKFVTKLSDDRDEDVRAAAAEALSIFAAKGLFQDKMRSERTVSKLIGKLSDNDNNVRQFVRGTLLALGKRTDLAEFLQHVVSTLNTTTETELRLSVYKVLKDLKALYSSDNSEDNFCKALDTAICKLLNQMQQKDRTFIDIYRSIAIMAEAVDEGLTGTDLRTPSNANKTSRDVVKSLVRSKLIYDKSSPDQYNVVLALSRLAKNDVFLGCLKQAISGLTESLSNSEQKVWSAAVEAISAMSRQDEFRTDLVPAIDKLIQQLNGWAEDDDYPLNLVEAMNDLVEYKEFQMKIKHVVPKLMIRLQCSQKEACNDVTNQEDDKNEVAFFKASCKLVSKLCQKQAVGKDLVPQLTYVLSEMNGPLNEDLHDLVKSLLNHGRLTMNDRIALASSLRITPTVPDNSELQIWKLNMAALLDEARKRDHPSSDYNSFLGAVLGSGSLTVKSKLSTLMRALRDTKSESDSL